MATEGTVRQPSSFADATKVERLDTHKYRVNLSKGFCIGAVPNGGYVASCMLAAAKLHLSSRGQPDTLTAHFEFPHRTTAGPAIVVIDDIKLGRQVSTLHLALFQGDLLPQAPWISKSSRRVILAYSTRTDLQSFDGITLPTAYGSTSAADLPAVKNLELLEKNGSDESWELQKLPRGAETIRSVHNWKFYLPKGDPPTPGAVDMWIRLASGERFTQATLPYIVDSFPFNVHIFLASPEIRKLLETPQQSSQKDASKAKDIKEKNSQRSELWFPTLLMNMEAKTPLPEEGVEWLAMRVSSKQIKDGKFDIDVIVRDLNGDIIALANQVALIVSMARNTAKRPPKAAL